MARLALMVMVAWAFVLGAADRSQARVSCWVQALKPVLTKQGFYYTDGGYSCDAASKGHVAFTIRWSTPSGHEGSIGMTRHRGVREREDLTRRAGAPCESLGRLGRSGSLVEQANRAWTVIRVKPAGQRAMVGRSPSVNPAKRCPAPSGGPTLPLR